MQVCGICGAQEDNGNISVDSDRERGINISDKDLFYTKCCQHAIARGRQGCLNRQGKFLDLPFLRVRPIV